MTEKKYSNDDKSNTHDNDLYISTTSNENLKINYNDVSINYSDIKLEPYNTLRVKKLSDSAKLPTKAHDTDLGYDLFSNDNITIYTGQTALISTGICVKFPISWGAFIKDRSSVATKQKLHTVAGVIDSSYTGEIKIALINNNVSDVDIKVGDKIAQMVLIQTVDFDVKEVDELPITDRGSKGFGSSDGLH